MRYGLSGIKGLKTGLMQIDPNPHNGAGISPGNSIQIDQNPAELAVTAPKIIGPLETDRSPAEISETVGHRNAHRKTESRHLDGFLLKTPPY